MLTAAVLLATKITLAFTGVTLLVPSVADSHLVRVVTPNGQTMTHSGVPKHFAYVMYTMKDWKAANTDSLGRRPDLIVIDPVDGMRFGVSFIKGELLDIGGSFDTSEKLCKPTKSEFEIEPCFDASIGLVKPFPGMTSPTTTSESSLHWLLDWSRGNPDIVDRLDPDVLQDKPSSTHVSMRMNLAYGRMMVLPTSFDLRYAYRYNEHGACQALARAVIVEMKGTSNSSTLTFTSRPFSNGTVPLPLKLAASGDLAVLIGNEPVDNLQMSVNLIRGRKPSELHQDTTGHMRLLEDLLLSGGLVRPAEIPAGACQMGMSPSVSPTDAGSDGGTCNPNGMPAKDPNPIGY